MHSFAVIVVVTVLIVTVSAQAGIFPCNAIPLDFPTSQVTLMGDISNGVPFTTPLGACVLRGNSLWYTFTVSVNGTIHATTCSSGTTFSSQLTMLTSKYNNCNSLTSCLGTHNDTLNQCSSTNNLSVSVHQGEVYYLAVSGATSGTFLLTVTFDAINSCQDPMNLDAPLLHGLHWLSGDFQDAEVGPSVCGLPSALYYVWYHVQAFPTFFVSTCKNKDGSYQMGDVQVLPFRYSHCSPSCDAVDLVTCPRGGGNRVWATYSDFTFAVVSPNRSLTYDLQYGYELPLPDCKNAIGPFPLTTTNQTIETSLSEGYDVLSFGYHAPWMIFQAEFTGRATIQAVSRNSTVDNDLYFWASPNPCSNGVETPRLRFQEEAITFHVKEGESWHVVTFGRYRDSPINIYFGPAPRRLDPNV